MLQHRRRHAQSPRRDERSARRGQVLDRARHCPEFREAREVRVPGRQRSSQAGLQDGERRRGPEQIAHR